VGAVLPEIIVGLEPKMVLDRKIAFIDLRDGSIERSGRGWRKRNSSGL
jgi:hypothetical protein